MRKIVFTEEQLKDIFYKYQEEHLSAKSIGANYEVSKEVILRVLRENGIEIKSHPNKYQADYRKFKDIDTAEKAYWLGFIAADGCVYERENNATIRIAIHQRDKVHLEKLKDFMNSDVKIKDFISNTGFSKDAPTPMSVICFNSKDMAHDLIDKGIVPRKSQRLNKPLINEDFYLPYILGYFDGDGTIYKLNNDNGIIYVAGFIGTYETIDWINKYLKLNATIEQRYKDSITYNIRCGGTNKPYALLKPLYDSTNVHLDRKYELFKELEYVVLNKNIK